VTYNEVDSGGTGSIGLLRAEGGPAELSDSSLSANDEPKGRKSSRGGTQTCAAARAGTSQRAVA